MNKPQNICLLGVDGSGKTALATAYLKRLNKTGEPAVHVWSRYRNYLSKPFLGVMRLTGHNRKEMIDGVKIGFHDFSENRFIAYSFLMFQWLDQVIDIVYRFRRRRGNIVCDRCVIDTLVDLCVDTGMDGYIFGRYGKSLITLMPKGTVYFIVNRNKSLVFNSRPDVRADKNYDRRIKLYSRAAKIFGLIFLDNDGSIEYSIEQIVKQVD
ncbi:MAG: hypothetical protein COB22_02325 [Cycloclasticus sp.]|nr:MAG: hypothetical protein COB22_02325 [Cycloclasticus sp.]